MNILVTIDTNYIQPFKIMLYSFFAAHPHQKDVTIYLLHSKIEPDSLLDLRQYCSSLGAGFAAIRVDRALFQNAPTFKRYPQEMYYRLLSPLILPQRLDKALYLDPDVLIINPLTELWQMNMQGSAFAAASHSGLTDMVNNVNKTRLNTDHEYFNTGVMLIDLAAARKLVKTEDIFDCVKQHKKELLLPDQDVFNILYGKKTLAVDDEIWNYDVRHYPKYLMRSAGVHDMHWLMENTAILHFCGKNKPWKSSNKNFFSILYKHYMILAQRWEALHFDTK